MPGKNFIIGFLLIIAVLVALAGAKNHKAQGRIEIKFWTLQLISFSDYINSVIKKYEISHPGIKIKWIDIPFSEGEKRSLAAVLSRDIPDLINMNPDFGSTLASKNALVNIKPLIPSSIYNNYLEAAWQTSEINGKIFGVPWYITSAVTVRNKKILEESGIPGNIKVLDYRELALIGQKIKSRTNKFVLMPPLTENGKMLKIFNQFGIPALNKEKNKALFNNEKANTVLLFWKELYDKKLIPSESLTTTHREMLEKFQAGETAFIVAGPNLIFQIKENSPELYSWLDVSEQLTGDSKKADFSLMNLVIPLKSKHPREALDFALFLTNAENQLNFCKLAPIIPSEKNALSSEYYNHAQKGDLMAKSRIISAHQLKNPLTTLPFLVNQKELNEIIDIMTQKVLLNKESSSDALRNAQIEWDNILMEN